MKIYLENTNDKIRFLLVSSLMIVGSDRFMSEFIKMNKNCIIYISRYFYIDVSINRDLKLNLDLYYIIL